MKPFDLSSGSSHTEAEWMPTGLMPLISYPEYRFKLKDSPVWPKKSYQIQALSLPVKGKLENPFPFGALKKPFPLVKRWGDMLEYPWSSMKYYRKDIPAPATRYSFMLPLHPLYDWGNVCLRKHYSWGYVGLSETTYQSKRLAATQSRTRIFDENIRGGKTPISMQNLQNRRKVSEIE